MSWVPVSSCRRREIPITNAVLAATLLLSLFLPLATPLKLPEFVPPQVIYSRDLVPLLLAPWSSPSSTYRVLSRLLQSTLLFRLPKDVAFSCYASWIVIGLSRTLVGFLLSRSVGWTYPHLFNHWALYEQSGGCGPSLVACMIASGTHPDFSLLLLYLRGYKWEVTDSLVLLVACLLLTGLDHAPWTYGVAIVLALLAITCRTVFAAYCPLEPARSLSGPDAHQRSSQHRPHADIETALLLFVLILLPAIMSAILTTPTTFQIPPPSRDNVPFLEILVLSYPRPNDTPSSDEPTILTQTIASYLPYMSSSTALSVFTHAPLSTHPAFTDAQLRFSNAPITFYVDDDTHPDAYEGQHLHLAEAFKWMVEKSAAPAEWVMLVEDDFPICGEWGWQGVLGVMYELEWGHNTPSPETTKMWGGFVGTGGSGLIIHHTLLPILADTLRLHALIDSPFPPFATRRPADIIIQDCLLGRDPLCPTASSSRDVAESIWFDPKQPTMVITSRLVMDHIGGHASATKGRVYDLNKWRCGWRHPFHGRPEVAVVPVR